MKHLEKQQKLFMSTTFSPPQEELLFIVLAFIAKLSRMFSLRTEALLWCLFLLLGLLFASQRELPPPEEQRWKWFHSHNFESLCQFGSGLLKRLPFLQMEPNTICTWRRNQRCFWEPLCDVTKGSQNVPHRETEVKQSEDATNGTFSWVGSSPTGWRQFDDNQEVGFAY